jgi:hypothetical protein
MKPLLIAADVDGGVEELGKTGCGEELLAGTVTYDAAGAHKNDALDLRQDVAEVMRDEHEAGAFSGEAPEGFSKLTLCGKVEGVGGLVEKQLAGAMDESAGDKDAPLFTGRHFTHKLIGEVSGFHALQGFGGEFAHFIRHVEIGPERGCRKESGDDGIEPGRNGGAFARKLGAMEARADHAKMAA